MTSRRFITFICSASLLLAACTTSTNAEVGISETPTAVIVTSGTGSVSVAAGEPGGATVTAEIASSGDEPPWSAEIVGTELVVDDGCGDRTDCEVNLIIEIDGTADVTITTSDGGVTVVNMNSTVAIAGTSSNIVLNGITGPLDIDLASGNLSGVNLVSTDASFVTGEGDLDVTLTQAFDSLTVESGKGDVTAQVPDGGYVIAASTADGEVEINVDEDASASATITMRTGAGDVTIYRR